MISRWLTQTAVVKRLVAGSNGTENYQVLASVPCLIQEIDGNSRNYTAMGIFRPHRMYCSLSTDIQDDDHIEEGGRKFIVNGTIKREQGQSVKHLEVLLDKKDA